MKTLSLLSTVLVCSLHVMYLSAATNLLFIHHSVGAGWLDQGELATYLPQLGFDVHDTDYGDAVPGIPHPEYNPIGDYTDVCHWYYWFHYHMPGLLEWECLSGQSNQIIMFKSCYPNSAIYEDGTPPGNPTNEYATVWNYKAAYLSLTNVFSRYPAVMFIPVTAPPMRPGDGYNPADAARGRAFNDWLRGEYCETYRTITGLRNVAVFDLCDILAVPRTKPRGANALYPKYRSGDSHPNARGGRMATGAYLPFIRTALHYMQTGEMVTNSFLKLVNAKFKSGMLKIKANVDSIGGTPGAVSVYCGTSCLQTFEASSFRSRGVSYSSKVVSSSGKKAMLKLSGKREPSLIMKIPVPSMMPVRIPLRIYLGNGQTYVCDLLMSGKSTFP